MRSSRPAARLFSAVTVGALLASTVAAAFATNPSAGGADTGAGATSSARATPGASTHRVTLVTGDVAELTVTAAGQRSARLVDGGNYYLGTASAGKRKGVAPGAQLLIGKVLDNSGSGLDSEAIAGMEWAARGPSPGPGVLQAHREHAGAEASPEPAASAGSTPRPRCLPTAARPGSR